MGLLFVEHAIFLAELDAARAELRLWESEDWDDGSYLPWYRSHLDALGERAADNHAEDERWLAGILADVKTAGLEGLRNLLAQLGPDFASLLTEAQGLRDREWVTTATAARIYGCSPSYMRRMARNKLSPHDKHQHPDGGWRIRCGAIRKRRKS